MGDENETADTVFRAETEENHFIKSKVALLMAFETVLGLLCLALLGNISSTVIFGIPFYSSHGQDVFFLTVIFHCFSTTLLLLATSFISSHSANILPRTAFYALYHLMASVFYFCCSFSVLIQESKTNHRGAVIAASIFGLFNTIAYVIHTLIAYQKLRSG